MDIFQVGSSTAVQVPADSLSQVSITHAGGGTTLYYKNASDVSTSSSDGTLTVGQSVSLSATNWIIGSAEIKVFVKPTPATSSTDLTASDDLSVGDDATVTDALAVGGASTLTGGIVPNLITGVHNWQPIAATSGTDTAGIDGTQWVTSIFVPANKTITSINYLVGSVGGTNKVYGVLYSSTGAVLKNTSLTGGGATAGTAAQIQTLGLTSTYAAVGPATYFVGISINGTTAKVRTVPNYTGNHLFSGSVSQTHGTSPTVAAITPPSAFADATAPVVFLN